MNRNSKSTVNHRQLLGAVGAAAGAVALVLEAAAAPPANPGNQFFARVAAVRYSMPFHDHRANGVNLQALRKRTVLVAKERPDYVCYPEVGTCIGKGFEQGMKTAPELEPYAAVVGILINRELFHIDYNQNKFPAIREKYRPNVEIEVWEPEGYFQLASRRPDLLVEPVATEFGLETNRDDLA